MTELDLPETATAPVAPLRPRSMPSGLAETWWPGGWRDRDAEQQPDWPDPHEVEKALATLARRPPLVLPGEVDQLRCALADVAVGKGFLLQAGDCAELFRSCTEQVVRRKFRLIQQLAVLFGYGSGLPVVKVGRIAGQFGKPRSHPTEVVDGVALPVYRGDIVNDPAPTAQARQPDPERLVTAYDHASATLNLLRALPFERVADVSQAHADNQAFVLRSPAGQAFERVADDISLALRFLGSHGQSPSLSRGDMALYTSHEALLPAFEEALTRQDPESGAWYGTSAHLLWAGDRTRQIDGAHVELLRGLANPIGIKVGPSTDPESVRRLCERVDPQRSDGRIVLIARMGAERVTDLLGPLIESVRRAGFRPVWTCDPMHGNTYVSSSGFKTRRFNDILAEISGFLEVNEECGTHPGGLHLEVTGESHVTECVGGAQDVRDDQLAEGYESACDPRLNADQAIELGFRLIAEVRRRHHPWSWARMDGVSAADSELPHGIDRAA